MHLDILNMFPPTLTSKNHGRSLHHPFLPVQTSYLFKVNLNLTNDHVFEEFLYRMQHNSCKIRQLEQLILKKKLIFAANS